MTDELLTMTEVEKALKRIERGEAQLRRRREVRALLLWKTQQCEDPWRDMVIPSGAKLAKTFTEEEDRWLVKSHSCPLLYTSNVF